MRPAPVHLVASVVVPALDEAERIDACVAALARQRLSQGTFEVLLVDDGSTDDTVRRARRTAAALGLTLWVLPGPGAGPGLARATGMDAAARRLIDIGRPDGLVASTDADSIVAPDWLPVQLALIRAGALAIGGDVALDDASLPSEMLERRRRHAAQRLTEVRRSDPTAEHHHFAGASLAVTAATYEVCGGLDRVQALEDAAFSRRLSSRGIPILRSADVRVRTAARTEGRAAHGLSTDLALSAWALSRRYDAADFSSRELLDLKGTTRISVILPAKEVADTIGGVLRTTAAPALALGLVDEILVVDAASQDGSARVAQQAGARVVQQDALMAHLGPARGKGDAMWRALGATDGDLVCFLDADTADPTPALLTGLIGPLLVDPAVHFVKGAFDRPLRTPTDNGVANEGGRVTELMARPLLNHHAPLLAGFAQPLAGEVGARRELLERLPFPVGYGIEIAMLMDALALVGLDGLAECQLGSRQNRHQPLRALGEMAYAVLSAVERRAGGSAATGQYVRPWDDLRTSQVPIDEHPPWAEVHRSAAV